MNGNAAIQEYPTPGADCAHEPAFRFYYTDPNTGVAYIGCLACGLTLGPLNPTDDLTMRPRDCGCKLPEEWCNACANAPILHNGEPAW